MKLSTRSSLADVAVAVGDALRRARIRAILTGGACASLYTEGEHASIDADFVLVGPCTTNDLDRALATAGFQRDRDRYVHPDLPFFVEFPRGPLGIGQDFDIRPVWKTRKDARTLALSPTDACRDRLAAFYHWNDRQSLAVAVAIALRHRIHRGKVRDWSRREGHAARFEAFLAELARARARARRPKRARGSRGSG